LPGFIFISLGYCVVGRGKIVWTDSPLVKAVKEGHVLVVDEADKGGTTLSILYYVEYKNVTYHSLFYETLQRRRRWSWS
jgi:hypoxanthine phosphoribosyltransferase